MLLMYINFMHICMPCTGTVFHRFLFRSLSVPALPQPVSPTASLTSSNTITVSWTAPTMRCSSIDDYIVVYNDGTGNTSVISTGLTATLSNLQSATTYSLFVAARSNGVAGLSAATSPAMITTLLASMYVCAN